MDDVAGELHPQGIGDAIKPFQPIARYYPSMDQLIYLKEDRSYRADRVDPILTLLWHPYEMKLIGIKIKGFRHLWTQSPSLAALAKDDATFLPLAAVLGTLILKGYAEAIIKSHEEPRRKELVEKYNKAIAFVANDNVTLSTDELQRAA